MDSKLENKVVLVTGASGGIGSAAARLLAAEKARLVLHYRSNREAAERLQTELGLENTLLVHADLTVEAEVGAMFARARARFGRVDTLVANAGIWVEEPAPIREMSLEQWRRTLDVNLTSVFLCCREFFELVEVQGQGNLILISSTAGVFGEAGHADYSASKSAMAYGLTRTLKNEIARIAPHTADYCGGRVNCICPGWTASPMTAGQWRARALVEEGTATMALPQIARPEDVGHLVVFLASDHLARHITGQTVVLAGGMEGRLLWKPGEIDPEIV